MKSLFDDTKNPVFRELCRIINEIRDGKRLTRKEILARIFNVPEFIYAEFPDLEREKQIVDTLFKFNKEGFAEIPPSKNFSLPLTDTELGWLSAVLADEELFFLLPKALREKLSERLKNFSPLYGKSFWRKLRTNRPTNKSLMDKLSVAVEALIQQKKLICDTELLTPCRLESDLFSDKYFLIVQREQEEFEKILVESLGELRISEENIPSDTEDHLKKFYTDNVAEVTIKVQNTRNAVERCFALFSSFDKKSRLQDDGTYFLVIRYCKLDAEEIFEKILSLGAMATVIEPKEFREQVIKKFQEIKTLYV